MSLREANVSLIDCVHKTPPAADFGYPYVAIPQMKAGRIDISDARRISKEHLEEWTKKANPVFNDVILSRRCNPGETDFVDEGLRCALGQNLVLLRADGTRVYPPFLRWLVRSPEWWGQVEKFINAGAVFDSLKCKDIPNFQLTIPPIENQKDIADFLGAIDAKIELNRQIHQTLEQIAQAIFKSWFVDFDPVKAKIETKAAEQDPERAAMCVISGKSDPELDQLSTENYQQLATTAALFPDALVESALGLIPEGWGPQRLENLLELSYGKALKKTDRKDGDVPVYGSGGITGFHNVSLTTGPGIIVGRKGTVGALYWEDRDFFPIDTVFYVKPKDGITLELLFYLLQTLGLEKMNTDAAVPGLNRNNAYRLSVPNYPKKLIDIFSELVGYLREKVFSSLKEIETLTTFRDTLLPKLLSGELEVSTGTSE